MKIKTAAQHEKHLNELYADTMGYEQAQEEFCYLNNGKIKPSTIATAYHNHTLGTLLRKYDPIAFNVSKND
jgi:hypothetical protein